ncbi:MAG: hypothetical protein KGM16_18845 [Bacteroidota bacterium]|nr:hypothetical protein [Bacteroidota bacterium]
MRKFHLILILTFLLFNSCKKDSTASSIVGNWNWAVQYFDYPPFSATPQSTGTQEILVFKSDNTYSLAQNSVIINAGTYKISSATNSLGIRVSSVLFSNSRVKDSIAYFNIIAHSDSLYFSNGLMGTVGSGARYYVRHK